MTVMKKLRFLLFTVCVLVMILTLFSCDRDPVIRSAEDLFEAIDTRMSNLDSYKVDGEVDMTFYVQGIKMGVSGSTEQIFSDLSNESCYVYSKSDLIYVVNERDVVTVSDLKAYYDGNAFVSTSVDAQERKLYSPMSHKDFTEYFEYLSDVSFDDEDLYECDNVTFAHNENGSWDMSLSGYSQKFIADYVGDMGFFDESFDDKVVDMQITVKANSKFHVTKMTLELIFEDDGNAATDPKVVVVMYFSDHGTAEPITEGLNAENYTEVVDVRLVEGVESMIDDIKNSDGCDLALTITKAIGKSFSKESDNVKFGVENEKYYYDVHSVVGDGGITYDISYRDGEVTLSTAVYNGTTLLDSYTTTNKQTDAEAKEFIDGLINSVGYDPMYVSDIEKCDDGRYKVSLLPSDVASYKKLVSEQVKGGYEGATHVIYFTVEDGKILNMESEIIIKYSYWTGLASAIGEVIFTAVVEFG